MSTGKSCLHFLIHLSLFWIQIILMLTCYASDIVSTTSPHSNQVQESSCPYPRPASETPLPGLRGSPSPQLVLLRLVA